MKDAILTFLIGMLAVLLALPAFAQGAKCMPREILVQSLSEKYGEILTGGGLQNPHHLLEVWSSTDTGSFTVFITGADGTSCIVATGQYWSSAAAALGDDPT